MTANLSARTWTSNTTFLFAAVGAAVGLGNIWRFPYIAGANGGGAFILLYILFVITLCIPMVMAELFIGRRGRGSPVLSVRRLCEERGLGRPWQLIGWNCVLISALVFSFYSVVAGWSLDYFTACLTGDICRPGTAAGEAFPQLLQSPLRLIGWHSLIILFTVWVVARGVRRGVESVIRILLPGLFAVLLILVGLAAATADFAAAFTFLLRPDFSKITPDIVLMALGQAFFSVAVGGGAMMTYGAYLSQRVSLVKMAAVICLTDTLVALLAGFAIFPFVFAFGLDPSEGPGLIFVTLPLAFAQLVGGEWIGSLFFILLALAALTTTLALLEPIVAWLEDFTGYSRLRLTAGAGFLIWLAGIAEALSFNVWRDFKPFSGISLLADKNLFGLTEFLVSNVLLPLNNLMIAVFVAWFFLRRSDLHTLGFRNAALAEVWLFMARYPLPVAILAIFLLGWH